MNTLCRLPEDTAVDKEEKIFLSMEEAISAIRNDFNQYPAQTRLFLDLCPLILGPDIAVVEDGRYNGLWISAPERRHFSRMRKITHEDLGRILVDSLAKSPPDAEVMAEICRRTFLTAAEPGENGSAQGRTGIRIDTGMADFQCNQCGKCCRELDYRHELSAADYLRWQELGRTDILERVATISRGGEIISYAIWVEPGTRDFAGICPWLARRDERGAPGKQICLIHEVKPEICRQYPGSRKHAKMTGCTGF